MLPGTLPTVSFDFVIVIIFYVLGVIHQVRLLDGERGGPTKSVQAYMRGEGGG